MKRIFYTILLTVLFLTGCQNEKNITNFTDIHWVREGQHDTEILYFGSDGSFSYSCSCGNPVNDSDLCDGYIYDENTQEIILDYCEVTDDSITILKIMNLTKNELQIDFDGEIRTFTKE